MHVHRSTHTYTHARCLSLYCSYGALQTPLTAKRESSELQCNSEMTKAPRYSERATCPDYILDILPAFHRNGETFQSVTSSLVPFALYK